MASYGLKYDSESESMQNRSAVYHPFLKQMKREYSLKSDLKLKELKIEHEFKDSTDELQGYLFLQVANSSRNSALKTLHVAMQGF